MGQGMGKWLLTLVMVVLLAAMPGALAVADPSPPLSADEQRALELLNADRLGQGLAPLAVNNQLVQLARAHAQDMIDRNYASHTNPEGQSPFDRMRLRGISYRAAAENIAADASVEDAQAAFMNSPGHRSNILGVDFSEVGVGVRRAANGSVFVVQEFIGR